MRYSATTNGFYSEDIVYESIPDDYVEITDSFYDLLINGQASGNYIAPDDEKKGYPTLIKI